MPEIRPPKIDNFPELKRKLEDLKNFFNDINISKDKITYKVNGRLFTLDTKPKDFRDNIESESERAQDLADNIGNDPEKFTNDLKDSIDNFTQAIKDQLENDKKTGAQRSTDANSPEKQTPSGNVTAAVKGVLTTLGILLPYILFLAELGYLGQCASRKNVDNQSVTIKRLSAYNQEENSLVISFVTQGLPHFSPAMNDVIMLDHANTASFTTGTVIDPTDKWIFSARVKGTTDVFIVTRETGGHSHDVKPLPLSPKDPVQDYDYGTCNYSTSFSNQLRSCINNQIGWVIAVLEDAAHNIDNAVCDLTPWLPIVCKPVNWYLVLGIIIVIVVVLVILSRIF
jgi:hypothetical protein